MRLKASQGVLDTIRARGISSLVVVAAALEEAVCFFGQIVVNANQRLFV